MVLCFTTLCAAAAAAAASLLATTFDSAGKAKFSDLLIPWATFTEPEVAHVGLYPRDMEAKSIAYDTYTKQVRHCLCCCGCLGVVRLLLLAVLAFLNIAVRVDAKGVGLCVP